VLPPYRFRKGGRFNTIILAGDKVVNDLIELIPGTRGLINHDANVKRFPNSLLVFRQMMRTEPEVMAFFGQDAFESSPGLLFVFLFQQQF